VRELVAGDALPARPERGVCLDLLVECVRILGVVWRNECVQELLGVIRRDGRRGGEGGGRGDREELAERARRELELDGVGRGKVVSWLV